MPSNTTVRVSHEGEQLEAAGTAGSAVAVRPVDRVDGGDGGSVAGSGDPARPAGSVDLARLHRLVLETRVAALEEQLAHKQRQLEVIRTQYEQVLDQRDRAASDAADDRGDWVRVLPVSLRR